jgi:galacturonokinase
MENQDIVMRLREAVATRYGVAPGDVRVVRSPYRVCPLGAHIDHQLGPVTAMAIDRAVHLAYAPSGDRQVRLSSLDFSGETAFSLDDVPSRREADWGNYARGAAVALAQSQELEAGLVGVTAGRLGEGGLSSSAAIGVAYLMALEDANNLRVSVRENIELDRKIENGYLGLNNGVLDQSAILLSRRDHLTLIDCKTSEHRLIPKPDGMPPFKILIAFSGLQQALVSTGYNLRVQECRDAARALLDAAGRPEAEQLLGHVTPGEYAALGDRLAGPSAKRARHFFSEADRVSRGTKAWQMGDLAGLGALMSESGRSSIDNYECGSEQLIALYDILLATDGVAGARFSGAGFRGCCVAFVASEAADGACERVRKAYADRYPELSHGAPVFCCESDNGARIL